jgi:hypothetical protein
LYRKQNGKTHSRSPDRFGNSNAGSALLKTSVVNAKPQRKTPSEVNHLASNWPGAIELLLECYSQSGSLSLIFFCYRQSGMATLVGA